MHRVLEAYKNLSKPAKASVWFILSNVILKGISFFTLPIFSRLLTPDEYGTVSVYNSWVATVSIITTLNTPPQIVNFVIIETVATQVL